MIVNEKKDTKFEKTGIDNCSISKSKKGTEPGVRKGERS